MAPADTDRSSSPVSLPDPDHSMPDYGRIDEIVEPEAEAEAEAGVLGEGDLQMLDACGPTAVVGEEAGGAEGSASGSDVEEDEEMGPDQDTEQ